MPGPLNLFLAALLFCPQGSWMGPGLPTGLTRGYLLSPPHAKKEVGRICQLVPSSGDPGTP